MATRTRNFASIVYPESAPDDWKEILQSKCIKAFISPLHDKDINADGTPKKPHYHVILAFNGVKTQEQAQNIFDCIGAVHCTPLNDLVAYARYLIHMDNPEKYQYNADEVVSLCGGDWSSLVQTSADRYKALADICDYCVKHNITSYAYLVDDLRLSNYEWFKITTDNTVFLKNYLQSRQWSDERLRNGQYPGFRQ